MQADQLSALGGLVGSGIAFVALLVSVYAAVIARRSARAAEKQAEIAARSYNLTAAPEMEFEWETFEEEDGRWPYEVSVSYLAGPPVVWCRLTHTAQLFTDTGVYKIDRSTRYWQRDIPRGSDVYTREHFQVPSETTVADRLILRVSAEMIEPPGGSDPELSPKWRSQRKFMIDLNDSEGDLEIDADDEMDT